MWLSTIRSKSTAMLPLVLASVISWAVTTAQPTDARLVVGEEAYSGTVRDAMTGKPVGGIKVVVRRLVNGKSAGNAQLASDTAGRFRIELPAAWAAQPEAQLAVDVEAPRGYVAFPYRAVMDERSESGVSIGDLRWQHELGVPPYFDRMLLFPTKEIRGLLQTPDGKPADGVAVVACSVPLKDEAIHRVVRRTKTDSTGRFTVEVASPGRVVLYYLPEHYAARYVKLNKADGDLGAYKLEKGVEVTGKLMDVQNQPLPGRWVRVGTPAGPEWNDRDLAQVGLGGFARWCKTGPGGAFHTAPLPAGAYEVSTHGVNRWAGIAESFPGSDPSWDDLAGRERVGEPLEACIVPQKVVVRSGNTPPVVLRAVPHVNIEIRATDGNGGRAKVNFHAFYRYVFEGKEYFTYSGFVEMPTARDGRLVVRVPRGAIRFDAFLIANGTLCRIREGENGPNPLGPNYVTLQDLDTDKTIACECRPWLNAGLKLSGKDGSPLKEVEVDARQGPRDLCYPAQVGDGIYWIAGIQPNRPLQITVKAKGYKTAEKEIPVADGSPGRMELILEREPGPMGQISVGPNVQVSKAHEKLAHAEVVIATDATHEGRLLAGSMVFGQQAFSSIAGYMSMDGGKTWRLAIERIEKKGHTDPAVAFGPDGGAYFAGLPNNPDAAAVNHQMEITASRDEGRSWSAPLVARPRVGTDMDRPFLAVDGTHGRYHGYLYCCCLSGDLAVYRSRDGARTFDAPRFLMCKGAPYPERAWGQ